MSKKIILAIISLLALASCSGDNNNVQEKTLEPETTKKVEKKLDNKINGVILEKEGAEKMGAGEEGQVNETSVSSDFNK